jgi:hypothetical protein
MQRCRKTKILEPHRHSCRWGLLWTDRAPDRSGCSGSTPRVQLLSPHVEFLLVSRWAISTRFIACRCHTPVVTMSGRPPLFRGGGLSQGSPPELPRNSPGTPPALGLLSCRSVRYAAFVSGGGPGCRPRPGDGRSAPGGHLAGPCRRCADQRPPGSLTPAWQAWEVILNRRSWPSQMPDAAGPVSTLVDAAQPLLPGRGG